MEKFKFSQLWLFVSIIFIFMLMGTETAFVQQVLPGTALERGVFFSTEEDFITQGPKPADGNPIISDGDLLHSSGYVYMRNHELLEKCCKVHYDLGLDAVDVIDVKKKIVAFSTELDDPNGSFTAGDLVFTNGASLPNFVLLTHFRIPRHLDLGLDAVQFIGKKDAIIKFIDAVRVKGKRYWIEKPGRLMEYLKKYNIDIWFSTEGTAPTPNNPGFLDGDLLSAKTGTIVLKNQYALPQPIPAGIPDRGVDFGMDAVFCDRRGNKRNLLFSTEILYKGKPSFTDGDVLLSGNGVVIPNPALVLPFEPKANFLGLDALSLQVPDTGPLCVQITKVGGISTADINPVDGLATSEKSPFGQWVTIHGCVPNAPDINPAQYEYRVQYKMDGETAWHPILMRQPVLRHPSLSPSEIGWQVTRPIFGMCILKVERWIEGPDYDTDTEPDGWNRLDVYWADKFPCNPDMPLVIWNTYGSGDDPDGRRPDGKYWLRLTVREINQPATEIHSSEVLIVLDNTRPDPVNMKLLDAPDGVSLECELTGGDDISITIVGQVRDKHFRYYDLSWTGGDNHSWGWIPLTAAESGFSTHYRWYDSGRTDLGVQGTEPDSATDVPLGTYYFTQEYNNFAGTDPIPCGYTVRLRAWDRTIRGYSFQVENNIVFTYYGWWTDYMESFCYAP